MIKLNLPEIEFYPLFHDLAVNRILADGKALSDSIPKFPIQEILFNYSIQKQENGFDLTKFYNLNFEQPKSSDSEFETDKSRTILTHLENLWSQLTKQADKHINGSTLVSLPNPYIVPGGRFSEIYYWDSYFTMLGLKVSGKKDIIKSMIDNFAYLIDEIGFIPNGNRTYFLSRSQPPFFAMMISLLDSMDELYDHTQYLNALEKEYLFWTKGDTLMTEAITQQFHSLLISNNEILHRYWDNLDTPRSEMYADDLHLASNSTVDHKSLFRNLRCACESGWDFSSRWCSESLRLETIRTSELAAVDLNCLLYNLEKTLANFYKCNENLSKYNFYSAKAESRKELIQKYFWNDVDGFYYDYDFTNKTLIDRITVAGIFPLVFGIASSEQAKRTLKFLEKHLLRAGGIVTTNIHSGQQWDAPNGWAPLQWMVIKAAENYGHTELAETIAVRWLTLNKKVFDKTGKMMEKYNVEDTELESGGGEYPVQDGFGWTNGVFLALNEKYKVVK